MQGIYVSATSLGIFFICHFIIWQVRSLTSKGFLLLVGLGLFSYTTAALFYYFILKTGIMTHISLSFPLFSFVVMLYLHFYVGMARSVSIRLLGELSFIPAAQLGLEEIKEIYSPEDMIGERLELLVRNGWLYCKEKKYFCSAKGEIMAKAGLFLKKLYKLGETG